MGMFDAVMAPIIRGKSCRFMEPSQQYACAGTDVDAFPVLRFAFGKAKFEFQPREYVQDLSAQGHGLVPRLRKHVTRNGLQFWVFGDFFIRKYYTVFDHGFLRLGFVCASGQEQACEDSARW